MKFDAKLIKIRGNRDYIIEEDYEGMRYMLQATGNRSYIVSLLKCI